MKFDTKPLLLQSDCTAGAISFFIDPDATIKTHRWCYGLALGSNATIRPHRWCYFLGFIS
jgi:hypothetical protein